uniref:Uncharacterized protein n=1 Tax=Molossus molossus TaxID=27622 RepID=A0A7J8J030_MOLMO|nr:hypothetical protein HJG59_010273 [Molossus molossus]
MGLAALLIGISRSDSVPSLLPSSSTLLGRCFAIPSWMEKQVHENEGRQASLLRSSELLALLCPLKDAAPLHPAGVMNVNGPCSHRRKGSWPSPAGSASSWAWPGVQLQFCLCEPCFGLWSVQPALQLLGSKGCSIFSHREPHLRALLWLGTLQYNCPWDSFSRPCSVALCSYTVLLVLSANLTSLDGPL